MSQTERSDDFETAQQISPSLASARLDKLCNEQSDSQMPDKESKLKMLAEQQALVLAVLAELLEAKHQQQALDGFVGALQQRFGVARVSLGIVADDGSMVLSAISQQAHVELSSNEVSLLLEIMRDALEQECVVCFPEVDEDVVISQATRLLGTRRENVSLAIVPLYQHAEPVAVLLFERSDNKPFSHSTIQLLEHIASISAPTVALRIEANRSVVSRAKLACRKVFAMRSEAEQLARWVLLSASIAVILIFTMIPMKRTVGANAELVPNEYRLVTVPFDGFVDTVSVQPGEQVTSGQLLAQLEQRELKLEEQRRVGEIASAEAEFRAAMFNHDRQATAIARARLEKERALHALVNQRLQRIDIRAPISGLIVSGDPKDAIGAPVSRGDTLFEIAKAEGYEVHLMVHERDIRQVRDGQEGTLSLRARPDQKLTLNVHTIHPVAESVNGASFFRVRAALTVPEGVEPRPGESGFVKLNVGHTNLINLLGRPLLQGLHELWWKILG